MKSTIAILAAIVFIALSVLPVPVFAQDNALDKAGDWWATRGKQEPEKTMILTQRRAERAAKRAEKAMKQEAKRVEKTMKEMFGK